MNTITQFVNKVEDKIPLVFIVPSNISKHYLQPQQFVTVKKAVAQNLSKEAKGLQQVVVGISKDMMKSVLNTPENSVLDHIKNPAKADLSSSTSSSTTAYNDVSRQHQDTEDHSRPAISSCSITSKRARIK